MYSQSIVISLESLLKSWSVFYITFFCFFSITWYRKHENRVLMDWPIVHMLPSLIQNAYRVHDWTVDVAHTFGCTKQASGPIFGRLDMLFTCDLRNTEHIVRTNFANYPKGADYNKTFDILGDGLFNVDFELWHTQRKTARTALASNNYGSIVANISHKLVRDALMPVLSIAATESSIVDLEDVCMRYTFDVTFTSIFGRNLECLSIGYPRNEFAEAMDDALEAVFFRHVTLGSWWKLCSWLKVGTERKLSKAWKTIDKHLTYYISVKKQELLEGVGETDLLSIYMNLKDVTNNEMSLTSDKFLRDTALTFLFAGRDTTGAALSWFLWLISRNPNAEAKILEELRTLISNNTTCRQENKQWVFGSDDLKGLVYLHAAVCEAIRLYPSLPINRKTALKDDVLPDGTLVKSGTMIIMSAFAMARMESIWGKDCLEFVPERWLDEHGKISSEAMNKFFPFSFGPRTCLGKNMAFTVVKSAAAAVLFNFHIDVVEGHIVCPKPSLVLRMKNGLMVRVKQRVPCKDSL